MVLGDSSSIFKVSQPGEKMVDLLKSVNFGLIWGILGVVFNEFSRSKNLTKNLRG